MRVVCLCVFATHGELDSQVVVLTCLLTLYALVSQLDLDVLQQILVDLGQDSDPDVKYLAESGV